jgi:hypothetical protein
MVASLEEFEGTVAYLQTLTEIELANLNRIETVLTTAGGLCDPLGSPPAVCATLTGATGVNQRLIGYGGSFSFVLSVCPSQNSSQPRDCFLALSAVKPRGFDGSDLSSSVIGRPRPRSLTLA